MKKLLLLAIVVLGISAVSFGQTASDVATASTSAFIITPIQIQQETDLNFGSIVAGVGGGTVTIAPTAQGTQSSTGDVILPTSNIGTPGSASFTVTGLANSTYDVSLTSGSISLSDGSNHSMSVVLTNSWSATSISGTGQLGAGVSTGTETIYVGGTLTVIGGQQAGTYTNASDIEVTVNYN